MRTRKLLLIMIFIMALADGSTVAAPPDWKMYRNEKYGFELNYPNEWEVLERDNTLPSNPSPLLYSLYMPPRLHPLYSVCFAPTERAEFYCEVELFVTNELYKFTSPLDVFLGFPVIAREKTRKFMIGGVEAAQVDVNSGGTYGIKNVWVQHDGLIFLLMSNDRPQEIHSLLWLMADSFRFTR